MATYMTWYSLGEYGKLWFDADNEEHAEYLLNKVREGELAMGDLPNSQTRVKGADDFEFESLEEMD